MSIYFRTINKSFNNSIIGNGFIIASSDNGLYYSTDNGLTWNISNVTFANMDIIFIYNDVVIVGSSNDSHGLYYSNNKGFTYTNVISDKNFVDVYTEDGINWIASSFIGVYYSSDSGSSWKLSSGPNGNWFFSVRMVGPNAVGCGNGAYYSDDYGKTWTISNISFQSYNVGMYNNYVILGNTDRNRGIWYSSDYGHTYTQSNITDKNIRYVDLNGVYGVALCNAGNSPVYYSTNSGVTWNISNAPYSSYFSVKSFMNTCILVSDYIGSYVNGQWTSTPGLGTFYSMDHGATWTLSNMTNVACQSLSINQYGCILSYTSDNNTYITVPMPVQVPCFKEGSKILTDKGYISVELLKKGDLIKTLNHEYKPIVLIGKKNIHHVGTRDRIKEQLYVCSNANYPEITEDLILTGCHSILVDDFKSKEERNLTIQVNGDTYVTDNKYRLPACVDSRSEIYETPGMYTIYHFALDHDDEYMNYGVYANGLLVETSNMRYMIQKSELTLY